MLWWIYMLYVVYYIFCVKIIQIARYVVYRFLYTFLHKYIEQLDTLIIENRSLVSIAFIQYVVRYILLNVIII